MAESGNSEQLIRHLKDVHADVLGALRTSRLGFEDGIRRRVFTELGEARLPLTAH